MTKTTKSPEAYVREVTGNTLAYVQELQHEIATLQERVATLETERSRLRSEMDRRIVDKTEEYAAIEQQNANLANLYVASYRLHETLDRQEVLITIQEILANLVGSEEIGIFELTPDGERLRALWTFGVDETTYQTLSARGGVIGHAIATGKIFMASEGTKTATLSHETDLSACIPLTLGGQVTGAIAVFRLLEQKPTLTRVDRELFELLATHAATALYCTGLHARVGATASR
jgi:nitrate/nitrite-specific signal transduction histidine kinase